jgi:hypothetical protein
VAGAIFSRNDAELVTVPEHRCARDYGGGNGRLDAGVVAADQQRRAIGIALPT